MGSRSRRRAHGRQAANVGCVVRHADANQPGATAADYVSRTRSDTIENRNEGQKMNTPQTQQPDALRLADALHAESESSIKAVKYSTAKKSAAELRRQHAEIARLTAENRALMSAVSEAVADERASCMLVCEKLPAPDSCTGVERSLWDVATMACADAIRARGSQ